MYFRKKLSLFHVIFVLPDSFLVSEEIILQNYFWIYTLSIKLNRCAFYSF